MTSAAASGSPRPRSAAGLGAGSSALSLSHGSSVVTHADLLARAAGRVQRFAADVGRDFPWESLLGLQGGLEGNGIVLSQTAGGLVFAGYCVVLAVAGMVLSRVREIT